MDESNIPSHDPASAKVDFMQVPSHYEFTVGGYKVPHIKGYLIDGENTWNLVLDNRLAIMVPNEQLDQWLWFTANAMAIAAGFSSFGPASQEMNIYKRAVFNIKG